MKHLRWPKHNFKNESLFFFGEEILTAFELVTVRMVASFHLLFIICGFLLSMGHAYTDRAIEDQIVNLPGTESLNVTFNQVLLDQNTICTIFLMIELIYCFRLCDTVVLGIFHHRCLYH